MKQLNYNHLHYFYHVVKEGGVNRAAEHLHVTPQTISGQITRLEDYLGVSLFYRQGKKLVLTEVGNLAYSYAEDIFSLGDELATSLATSGQRGTLSLNVGVIDSIPKVYSYDLLRRCYELEEPVSLNVREGDFDFLLGEFALNKLDLIVSDRAIPPGLGVKGYSQVMTESGYSFFASKNESAILKKEFPSCLPLFPLLTPGDKSLQKSIVLSWLQSKEVYPTVVGEFDDTALMKFFGQGGYGCFFAPSIIEKFILDQFSVDLIGRTDEIKDQFYAVTPARKTVHPAVELVIKSAKQGL